MDYKVFTIKWTANKLLLDRSLQIN